MSIIRRISPGSAFKLGVVVYGLMGFLAAAFIELAVVARMNMPGGNAPARNMLLFGPAAIIVLPLLYGVMGGIFAALGALIYNVASRWVGGLHVDIN